MIVTKDGSEWIDVSVSPLDDIDGLRFAQEHRGYFLWRRVRRCDQEKAPAIPSLMQADERAGCICGA